MVSNARYNELIRKAALWDEFEKKVEMNEELQILGKTFVNKEKQVVVANKEEEEVTASYRNSFFKMLSIVLTAKDSIQTIDGKTGNIYFSQRSWNSERIATTPQTISLFQEWLLKNPQK